MDIKTVLTWGVGVLNGFSDSARLDAEVLLAYALKRPVTFLLAHDDSKMPFLSWWRYRHSIRRRKEGIPVAYLTGHKEFYFLDFEVMPDVLIPRPDTEILVEMAVNYLRTEGANGHSRLLLDVGTGSGCIPISILKNVDGLEAVAVDISKKALRVARRNATKHGVSDRIRFIESDLLGSVPPELFRGMEMVVTANLPYVPDEYPVTPSVHFEPRMAVHAGKDGLDLYRRFCAQIVPLQPRVLFLEALETQIPFLRQSLQGYPARVIKNLAGDERFVFFEKVK